MNIVICIFPFKISSKLIILQWSALCPLSPLESVISEIHQRSHFLREYFRLLIIAIFNIDCIIRKIKQEYIELISYVWNSATYLIFWHERAYFFSSSSRET